MTAPKPIDVSPLYSANLRALTKQNLDQSISGLNPDEQIIQLAESLADSDLKVNPETGEVVVDSKAQEAKDLLQQFGMVLNLIHAAGDDKKLDVNEAKALIKKLQLGNVQPALFMKHTQTLIDKRWGAIAKNLQRWSAKRPLNNLQDFLETYNQGLYVEEQRLGRTSLDVGKLIAQVGSLAYLVKDPAPLKVVDLEMARNGKFQYEEIDATSFYGDNRAIDQATENYVERSKALAAFKLVYEKALKEGEPGNWAYNLMPSQEGVVSTTSEEALSQLRAAGDLEITLGEETHTINGAEAAEILGEQFPFEQVFELATLNDPQKRQEKMMEFVEGERPGFFGFGGGNRSRWTNFDGVYNTTGQVNNLYFARSALGAMVRQNSTGKEQALGILSDMNGDGGGWEQWASAGVANGICLFARCEGPEFRTWSDEAMIDAPDQFARDSLLLFGGYSILRALKNYRIEPMRRLGIWARANKSVLKGTKATEKGMASVAGGYKFKVVTNPLAKLAVHLAAPATRKARWLRTRRPVRWLLGGPAAAPKAGLQGAKSKFGDFLLAGAVTYLIDEFALPPNDQKIIYDRNLKVNPLPVQDPAQIDFSDPMIQDYLKDQ